MEYNFREIEQKWQQHWKETNVYKVENDFSKPKYYVLDMFPYPSGAGLHVGHPLGYIASDIFARYKRLKGFNVLHPMGYDAFGLPAEQYAIEHGIHPAVSTKNNIENFRAQLDKIGFCFDWSREVNTSDPKYYKWTQWIFLQLFKSYFNRKNNKAESVESLIKIFEAEGNINHPVPNSQFKIKPSEVSNQQSESEKQHHLHGSQFTAHDWNSFSEKTQQDILMEYRLSFCGIGEVNWCEALGTVLANDEVVNGVSERGGFPVVKKKLRQWYLRITEYADRLLEGLQTVDFSEAMKEMQSNWIGKSYGAEIEFRLIPNPSPGGEGSSNPKRSYKTADSSYWKILKKYERENRKNQTEAEDILWQRLRNNQLGSKVRRQHAIEGFIADFVFLNSNLVIEIDSDYHSEEEQKKYDEARTEYLKELGFYILHFSNDEVINDIENVVKKIQVAVNTFADVSLLREEEGLRDEAVLKVYTTRPDTIFGVDFMVIAPEHELIASITTKEQQQNVDEYIAYVKSRSDRERQAEKKISGVFTGAYAINPFNQKQIPIWISEYVLAGYGTGAIMAVPCGDERDFKFAKHFNIPITNIIGKNFNGEEANSTKDAKLENSDFLNGIVMRDAINIVNEKLEALGIGKKKVNYKMRDAAFSRQRYWGEPFPIIRKDGIAYPLNENELPLELPHVESYKPGPEGEGPLANIPEWSLIPNPSPRVEKGAEGAANVPKYSVYTPVQYELAKQMRKEYTEAEDILWQELRGNKLGEKFRRQHPVDTYIVDFISLQNKLIVEVDGGYHENEEQKLYDENRTKVLNEIGFHVLRFTNEEVINNTPEVLKKIKSEINNQSGTEVPVSTRGEGQGVRETNTMPGYAGSSWYFLRYMDPHNDNKFCNKKASDYWNQVDVYVGGTEHAVGHLLYSRMWTKALYDMGFISFDEPFRKLVNQGMITGNSRFVFGVNLNNVGSNYSGRIFVSKSHYEKLTALQEDIHEAVKYVQQYFSDFKYELRSNSEFRVSKHHVHVDMVDGVELDINRFTEWMGGEQIYYILEEGKYICGVEVEKMSKSKFNTVNPNDLVEKFGADTFRMYEMFLGPVEQSKPWDTKGIEGVHRFLKKLWRLFYPENASAPSPLEKAGDEAATDAEFKVLHKAIKKIEEDTERFSYNTAVSAFMVCVNELSELKCHKKEILEAVLILLTPYAPHISEELYHQLNGDDKSILDASYPKFESKYLVETSKEYPVSINGKLRTQIVLSLDASQSDVEKLVVENEVVQKWLEGKQPKKIIYVKNKMVNIVI